MTNEPRSNRFKKCMNKIISRRKHKNSVRLWKKQIIYGAFMKYCPNSIYIGKRIQNTIILEKNTTYGTSRERRPSMLNLKKSQIRYTLKYIPQIGYTKELGAQILKSWMKRPYVIQVRKWIPNTEHLEQRSLNTVHWMKIQPKYGTTLNSLTLQHE